MAMATSASSAVSFSARPASTARPRAAARAGRVRAGAEAGESGGKWWAPLLGWSGKADYIEAAAPVVVEAGEDVRSEGRRRPFVGGLLTEEKARELRARMVETESFHDAMYHSAIASRLARSA
ncbi:hypothetical protein ABZP36_030171 [Zizania latifolia]